MIIEKLDENLIENKIKEENKMNSNDAWKKFKLDQKVFTERNEKKRYF